MTDGSRRSTWPSVPITSTSKPGTPRSRSSSSVRVTPWVAPMPSATSATRGGSPSVPSSRRFSRPRKAVAGAYGTAGRQASKTSVAAAPQSPPAPSDGDRRPRVRPRPGACARGSGGRGGTARVWLKSSACISASSSRAGRSRSIAREPRAQQRARSRRGRGRRPSAPLRASPSAMTRSSIRSTTAGVGRRAVAAAVGAQRDRHRGVRPLGGRALLAVRRRRGRRAGGRGTRAAWRPRAPRSTCGRCRPRRGRRSRRRRCRRGCRRRRRRAR